MSRVRRRRVIKLNAYTRDYVFAEDDFVEQQNPYTENYEMSSMGTDTGFDVYNRTYILNKKENMCNKFNPYTGEYEYVPCDWEVTFNPYTGKYEYAPKEEI